MACSISTRSSGWCRRARKLIIVCNPNNPTGARSTADDLDRIAAIAGATAAGSVGRDLPRRRARRPRDADDVGPLRSRDRHQRAVEGVRLARPAHRMDRRAPAIVGALVVSRLHDDPPGALSDRWRAALEPRAAPILARTRGILNDNFPVIAAWLDAHGGLSATRRPSRRHRLCTLSPRHQLDRAGHATTRRKACWSCPGDHFGMDGYLRLGFGEDTAYCARASTASTIPSPRGTLCDVVKGNKSPR